MQYSIPTPRHRLAPWMSGAIAFLALVLTLAVPGVARAQECGCTNVGPYKVPARTAPAAQETSPGGGTFRLETSQWEEEVTLSIKRTSTGATVENFFIPLTRAAWGFSPDGNRFMFRYAFPEPVPGSPQIDVIVLYDLVDDEQVHYTEVPAGATVAFSPHGRWYLLSALYGSNWSGILVLDADTGEQALYEELVFEAPPSSPGDKFGTIGLGFSPEADDRSFVWAYRQIGGTVQLTMKNLETRSTVLSTPVGGSSFWRFSPCGDALGLSNQTTQTDLTATIHKTATSGLLGTPKTFTPIPDLLTFDTTLEYHRITVVEPGTGQSTTVNVAPNTADTTCAPALALDQVTVSPTSVVGGTANATGTVKLNGAATGAFTVALASNDTSAATVPASVSVSSGAQTATFAVTTKAVPATRSVTITATANGVSRTATLTVNPSPVPGVASVAVSPTRLNAGEPATGTVTTDGTATASVTVSLASNLPSVASVPASVTVPAGQSSATFGIGTAPVPVDSRATITATSGGISRTATVTVLTTDRTCEPGTSDPGQETLKTRAFAAFDDNGTNADCIMPVEFGNGITVGAGSTGLPEGTPVQLQVTLRFDGSVHTNPPVGVGGTLAEGSSDYSIVEDSVPDNGEGFPQLVRFTADYTLQEYGFDPNGVNVYEDWEWELTSNGSDLQGADHYSEGSFDGPSSMVGDTGTLTATYWTTVGAHLAIEGRVSTVASAYGAGSAAVADFSNTFKAATTPAPGFEGLALVYDIGSEPVNLPPACAEGSASTPAGAPVTATLACTDPEGAALTYTAVDGPSHGNLSPIAADGSFTYTPAAGYTGPDSFTFTAGDGTHTSAVATFAITVTGSGSPTSKDQCKDGGWQWFDNPTFRNQGDCVSFVVAGEK
ncbi:MAG TPA: Ig-like domain-containing protein [Acidimicrobiales bacterium]|nr:Ig-like domain-containing protein [Acidimicrobiales bacterium]